MNGHHGLRLLAVALPLLGAPAVASHLTFDVTIDEFAVDGAPFGPADGAVDFFDDFEDGALGYPWGNAGTGTSQESGGRLRLTSPGEHYAVSPLFPLVQIDGSATGLPETYDGSGDFVATALLDVPAGLDEALFHRFLVGGNLAEQVLVGVVRGV